MERAATVIEAAAVCEPDVALPASHPWYVDLSPARGGSAEQRLLRAIQVKDAVAEGALPMPSDVRYARQLFTGLRGSGKSTELNQLVARLRAERYLPLLINGGLEFDVERQLTVTQVVMSLLWALQDAAQMGSEPFHLAIPAAADRDLNLALAEVLVEESDRSSAEVKLESELGLDAGLPFFAKVKLALKSLVSATETRYQTRLTRVLQRTSSLLGSLNRILDQVQAELRRQDCRGLVLIVDDLDHLPPRPSNEIPSMTVPQVLFDLRSADLKAPHAHLIYTFPSQLLATVNLLQSWSEPLFLPAIKIKGRSGGPYEPGRLQLRRLIEARLDVERVFAAPELLDQLVDFSGGYVRDLIRLVRFAANNSDGSIGSREVDRAKHDLTRYFAYLLTDEAASLLLEVDDSKRVRPEPQFAKLIQNNLVLTYLNDDDWADLHPAVRETPAYRERRGDRGSVE